MAIRKNGEQWTISKFVHEHNHELLIARSTSLLRGHRGVTRAQKKLILTLNESGVPIRKIMSVLSKESGGEFNVGCIGKDVENFIGNKRSKLFEEGDAQRLYAYFQDRQCKELEFVYSMQVDENLLRTWQEAMLGKTPQTIITDDDKGMTKAIAEMITTNEFEEECSSIFLKYGLVDNTWLQNLYNRRDMWVPAYLRSTFCTLNHHWSEMVKLLQEDKYLAYVTVNE
ncbi:protein FAR1-RELATED SEQUENCE 5-like [Juglans microcarpa x Juglans regia]|uniref:protein FAR1-RELATED SEQUENCE 5-like n=1 Tax=Juglans microcarpa x Juglans regia TaxID=2249226 RepID=UPI001B7DB61B|nr:protein FAR1-RELATED SEQUENCE 5-like [Juglans microcarpa x Juglans regia]